MRGVLIALVLVATVAGTAAAPADHRLVTGVLLWPARLIDESVAVVRGDDGVTYFVERSPAGPAPPLDAGRRVALVGREAFKPTHIVAAIIQPVPAGGSPVTGAAPVAVEPAASIDTSLTQVRVAGTLTHVGPTAVTLLTADGQAVMVDVSRLEPDVHRALRPGRTAMIVGVASGPLLVARQITLAYGEAPGRR